MGAITTHPKEHLVDSDNMIYKPRARLLRAARALVKDGISPPGSETAMTFAGVRGGSCTTEDTMDWQTAYDLQIATHVAPRSRPQATK